MSRYFVTLTYVAGLLLFGITARAQNQEMQADKPAAIQSADNPFDAYQKFSATLNDGLGRDVNRKFYRSGKLMRFDFPDHHRISDLETRITWLVYPKSCSRVPMLDPGVFPFSRKFRLEHATSAGKETVGSHTCKIEDIVVVSDQPVRTTFNMKLYEAEDLKGFPIKIDVENTGNKAKFTMNYSDVSLEPPDAKLFERPAKCDSLEMKPAGQQKPAKPAAKAPPKAAPKPE